MKVGEIPAGTLKKSAGSRPMGSKDSMAGTDGTAGTGNTARADGTAGTGNTVRTDGTAGAGLEDCLSDLRKRFPSAKIHIAELSGTQGVKDYAQAHYGSLQIVLSPKAIKRMMEDPEFKKDCERRLEKIGKALHDRAGRLSMSGSRVVGSGMVLDENGQVTEWTASIKEQKPGFGMEQKPGPGMEQKPYQPWLPTAAATKDGLISRLKTKDGKTIVFKKALNYRPARDLSRIAQAETQQMVRTTMSGIRASIYQLKSSGGNKGTVNQLVGQAEQVLLKARVKIKNLEKENLLKLSQKRAEQENHVARAAHLQRVLKERQVKRKVREYTQIRDHYPTPLELAQEEERAKEWAEQITGNTVGGAGIGAGDGLTSYLPSGSAVPMSSADTSGGGSGVFIDITL